MTIGTGLFFLAVGLAVAGYFIGVGLSDLGENLSERE